MKFTNYGQKVKSGKEVVILFERINNTYSKSKIIQLIKRTIWILLHIVQETHKTFSDRFLIRGRILWLIPFLSAMTMSGLNISWPCVCCYISEFIHISSLLCLEGRVSFELSISSDSYKYFNNSLNPEKKEFYKDVPFRSEYCKISSHTFSSS